MLNPEAREMTALAGSTRIPQPGARIAGPASSRDNVVIVLHLRSRNSTGLSNAIAERTGSRHRLMAPAALTRDEMEARYGATPDDIAVVEDFARTRGLTVVHADAGQRMVTLSGSPQHVSRAFGVTLETFVAGNAAYRGRTGPVHIPSHLAEIVTGVFGLDNRTVLQPDRASRVAVDLASGAVRQDTGDRAGLHESAFTLPEVGRLYNFPTRLSGTGECIAVIALNEPPASDGPLWEATEQRPASPWVGGFRASDLEDHFTRISMPVPTIATVPVMGGDNRPGSAPEADAAATLDVEIAGSVAPGARQVVYFAPNTTAGILAAVKEAAYDLLHMPSVIVLSWSTPENSPSLTPTFMQALNDTFAEAALMGITVCCSAREAAPERETTAPATVTAPFPAASPYALACGAGAAGSVLTPVESARFEAPHYQSGESQATRGRRLPDISALPGEPPAFRAVVASRLIEVPGSASSLAALWAALIALCNQGAAEPVGFLQPRLYGHGGSRALLTDRRTRNFLPGSRPAFNASGMQTPVWQAGTGLGSLDGTNLLEMLGGQNRPPIRPMESTHGIASPEELGAAMKETIRGLNKILEKSWRMTSMAL